MYFKGAWPVQGVESIILVYNSTDEDLKAYG